MAVAALISGIAFFYARELDPAQISAVRHIFSDHPFYPASMIFIFLTAGYILVENIFSHYIKPLKKISTEAAIISSTNHSHRLDIIGNEDIQRLSASINAFAEKLEISDRQITQEILNARKDTERERNLLAAIMAELPQGVVICNKKGRILLFNNLAKDLLTRDIETKENKYFIGIGRSLFKLIDKNLLENAIQEVEERLKDDTKNDVAYFITPILTGYLISAEVVPVLEGEKEMTGFILTFKDITQEKKKYNCTKENLDTLKSTLNKHLPVLKGALGKTADQDLIRELDLFTEQLDKTAAKVLETLNPNSIEKGSQRSPVFAVSRPEFYDFDLFKAGEADIDYLLDTNLKNLMYTVFDTETTGLDPDGGDEIISIAAVRIANNKIVYQDLFDELVDPKRDIPLESYNIHGIDYEMVAGKKQIAEVLSLFKNYTSQSVLVGHNIAFDMKMFKVKEKTTHIRFTNPVLDTLLLSAILHPNLKKHDMDSISKRLGIKIIGRHTALGDAVATAQIFLKLVAILNSNGILTLRDAINASQRTYYARLKY